jgi:2-keto-4-pentenoate hydratase/2-oxohepta-3-ene-1,7-dioic acid hydratase in catechol pathway
LSLFNVARATLDGQTRYLVSSSEGGWRDVTNLCGTWPATLAAVQQDWFSQSFTSCPIIELDSGSWQLCIPFESPSRFYGVALNYASRAEQVGVILPAQPFIFTKEESSLIASGEEIGLPAEVSATLEGEVGAVVTSVQGGKVTVAGRLAVNDMTFPERLGPPPGDDWFSGKNYPRTTTIGPWLVVDSEIDSTQLAASQTTLRNGSVCQRAQWTDLHHDLPSVLEYLASLVCLRPGDVVSLGTPRNDLDGIGQLPLVDKDRVEVQIEGLPPASFSVRVR